MGNETLKQMNVEVNDTHASDVKENLKQFLDTHETIVETKKQLDPLFTDVVANEATAEKIETTVNKEHIKNLLVAMKNEFSADGANYRAVYDKRGKAITFGLQSALRIMGYKIGNDEIDGRYGPDTRKAVMQFQEINGLTSVDGAAGVETFTALANANLDAPKITEEQSNIVPVKKIKAKPSKGDEAFYAAHTDFTELKFGGVMNKVYTVLNYTDVPDSIATNTVINFGQLRFFSNGKVYEYDKGGNIIRRGDKSELDLEGKWKVPSNEAIKEPAKVVTPSTPEIKDQSATFEQLQNNLSKIRDKTIAGFTQKWQQDWLKSNFPKGITLSYYVGGISILQNNSTKYTIDYKTLGGDKESISLKNFVDTLKQNLTQTMEKDHDKSLIETHLEGKSFLWADIFTAVDLKDDVMKTKIEKLKTFFKKSNNRKGDGLDISDVSVKLNKNGVKEIMFDFDNDNEDIGWNDNRTYNYNSVFGPDGSFDKKAFSAKIRNTLVNNLFNSPKYTKVFTNLNPLDLS